MAIVKITPLNVNGISPKNIATDLFAPLTGSNKTLIYPMDLATNPSFSHAIQFTVFDYSTAITDELKNAATHINNGIAAAQKLNNAAAQDANKAKSATNWKDYQQIIKNGKIGELASNMKPSEIAEVVSKIFRGSTYQTKAGKPQALISLYMPDHLVTSYDSNYTSLSMTETFGPAGYLANAYADKDFMSKLTGDRANLLSSPESRFAAAQAVGAVVGKLGGNREQAAGIVGQAAGVVANPQMQLLYQGITLREFQLDFIFTPVSSQEAKMVENIVNAFTYFSVPDMYNETGQYLIPPQVFNIKFAFTGNPGVLGAVQNVFTNTLSNILGSGAAAALQGSGEDMINSSVGSTGNAKVFKVGDCVLKNVGVDYTPNGWATYSDGYPIQTRLSLHFQEMDIVTKKRITDWTGYKGNETVMPFFNGTCEQG